LKASGAELVMGGYVGLLGRPNRSRQRGVRTCLESGRWVMYFAVGNGSVADNRIKSPIIMNLYVGNFSFDMTERTLRELFEPFGTVSEVKLITDRETGQSRGFGFVTMGNVSEGKAAIKGLDGKDKGGRKLTVNEARPKDDRGGRPSPGSRR